MQMAAPNGGIPGNFLCHTRMCVHAHACARVWGVPSHHPPPHPTTTPPPHPTTPPPPEGGTPGISQNSIALELIEIFQFRLKI